MPVNYAHYAGDRMPMSEPYFIIYLFFVKIVFKCINYLYSYILEVFKLSSRYNFKFFTCTCFIFQFQTFSLDSRIYYSRRVISYIK